jgi:hypothetical protein
MERTPEKRLQNLLAYFGWQGGTIHQVAAEVGVDSAELLYGHPASIHLASLYSLGACSLETCSKSWRVNRLAPKRKGERDYWLGVADAISICEEE